MVDGFLGAVGSVDVLVVDDGKGASVVVVVVYALTGAVVAVVPLTLLK